MKVCLSLKAKAASCDDMPWQRANSCRASPAPRPTFCGSKLHTHIRPTMAARNKVAANQACFRLKAGHLESGNSMLGEEPQGHASAAAEQEAWESGLYGRPA